MRVISRKTLYAFWQKHPGAEEADAVEADAEEASKAWYFEARHADWKTPAAIKRRYRSADFLSGNRVVFNIKGNRYRLVVKINYSAGMVYLRFIGTHAEYNRIDAHTI